MEIQKLILIFVATKYLKLLIMIKTKDLIAVKNGVLKVDDLLEKYPVKSLITDLLEMLTVTEVTPKQPKIVVSQEDYNRIIDLFRVKGIGIDGEPSKRGRKPKNQ